MMKTFPLRIFALLAVLALLTAACGSPPSSTTGAAATPRPSPTQAMMHMPDYAKNMKVSITSPADGIKVTANTIALHVATTGYTPTCALAGKANQAGTGHYHVLLDKSLINMYCAPTAEISLQNVKSGMHTLTAVPTLNDHSEIEENASSIKINYEPAHPLTTITDATFAGKPSITILSPKSGEVVSGAFDVVVDIKNFNVNCDLMGKPDVAGYGHWHVNLDSMTGPMMGMGTMLGMDCTKVFHATTQGLKSGESHTVIALLTDNGHAPLNPAVASEVTVKIG
jgi:hypothetical protein